MVRECSFKYITQRSDCLLRQGLSLNLEIADSGNLASQAFWGIPLSVSSALGLQVGHCA